MCNCIKEIQEKIKNELSSKNADFRDKKITDVSIQNVAIVFDSRQSLQLSSPVKIEYVKTNKKGDTVHKKESINISYTYCPFCGRPYEEGEVNEC